MHYLARSLVAVAVLGGCSAPNPPVPVTYVDGLNPGLSLQLEKGGEAVVEEFPAVPSGQCIEKNGWPDSILQSGPAEWSMEADDTLRITGEGWVVELTYVWRRGAPDFTELRYPTCTAGADDAYFLLTRT